MTYQDNTPLPMDTFPDSAPLEWCDIKPTAASTLLSDPYSEIWRLRAAIRVALKLHRTTNIHAVLREAL